MAITVTGINELKAALKAYQAKASSPKQKTAILAAGAQKVRQAAAKDPTPKSTEPHYYYRKGQKVEIMPGNLRKSMKVFRGKEGDVFIGPRVLRKLPGGKIGQTVKNASGYYASMLYGSAGAFRQKIMEPAMSKAAGAAVQAVERTFSKWHEKNRP
jgi:hypothetical protein